MRVFRRSRLFLLPWNCKLFVLLEVSTKMWLKPQTVDKPMLPKFDTHGESARGDWLFPLAIDILKNENFLGSSHF